ncbi:hypothetical protein OUZ56_001525 [Daphnia magna]|uniref:Uncharacterized protein n=1 Tax=Daphnia magna TaxID=35525 RepID=A0ABR0A3G0_9CRUS|nr:hypothetical protein OUZ56_001525 [Daphnia magna]
MLKKEEGKRKLMKLDSYKLCTSERLAGFTAIARFPDELFRGVTRAFIDAELTCNRGKIRQKRRHKNQSINLAQLDHAVSGLAWIVLSYYDTSSSFISIYLTLFFLSRRAQ